MKAAVQSSTALALTASLVTVCVTFEARAEPTQREPNSLATDESTVMVPPPKGGWAAPVSTTSAPPTQMKSPAMVGVGATFLVLGGLGTILGLTGVAIGADTKEESIMGLGGGIAAASVGVALFVGTPLVVAGAREVPSAPTLSIGPGGVRLSGSF